MLWVCNVSSHPITLGTPVNSGVQRGKVILLKTEAPEPNINILEACPTKGCGKRALGCDVSSPAGSSVSIPRRGRDRNPVNERKTFLLISILAISLIVCIFTFVLLSPNISLFRA